MDGRIEMDGWMDGQTDRDGWKDGWMENYRL